MASGWNLWVLLVVVARGIHNNYNFSLLHLYILGVFLAATFLLFVHF